MTHKLKLIRETPLARLYENAAGSRQWIPRSVCSKTLKWPPQNGQPPVHEVEIEDWFFTKNPWPPPSDQKEFKLSTLNSQPSNAPTP